MSFNQKLKKYIVYKSEILKRLYGILLTVKLKKAKLVLPDPNSKENQYWLSSKQIEQLKIVLDLEVDTGFISAIKEFQEQPLQLEEIEDLISSAGLNSEKEKILRILENRWFHKYFERELYFPMAQNPNTYVWRLYFALVKEMKNKVEAKNGRLAIFPETGTGNYEWELYWHRISPDSIFKAHHLQPVQILKTFSEEEGIDFIEHSQSYTRARNDPHPNIQGNNIMARDIFNYLKTNHFNEIKNYSLNNANSTAKKR